jgi:hypothetical protein
MSIVHALDGRQLGDSNEPFEVIYSEDNRLALLALLPQARRVLRIVSRDLDCKIYEHADTVAAIKGFALGSRRSDVRIIVRDISRIVSRGHRLVDLQRRMPSYISIRTPAKEHQHYNGAFLVVDGIGVLHRKYADRYEGVANFNDPQTARELANLFGEMWEHATVPPDLRTLAL